jgi:Domain of unknown function (DUF1874)
MKIGILNTSILTNDGQYILETISLETAKDLVVGQELEYDLCGGLVATAQIISNLLDITILANRQQFAQEVDQQALVFKLKGRIPEGRVLSQEEIEAIGFEWKLLTRLA